MTRKDYVTIAAGVREAALAHTDWDGYAEALADHLAAENPRFDRRRFLAACTPVDEWIKQAQALGVEHAQATASWSADGNSDRAERARVLGLLQDGDPAAFDYLPAQPDLSGQWADELTPTTLAERIVGYEPAAVVVAQLAEAYELGVAETFAPACEAALIEATER